MYDFLLQLEDDGFLAEDTVGVYERLKEHRWLYGNQSSFRFQFSKITDLPAPAGNTVIPVGSIEFVEKALGKSMHPICVPDDLVGTKFLRRRVKTVHSREEIVHLYELWGQEKLFVKSASVLKADFTDIYKVNDIKRLPQSPSYFVSEPISIESEWRCFVYRGEVQGVQYYSGDFFRYPDRKSIEEIVAGYKNAPEAYTADIAVIADGQTVLIEVHNFVSCGLYGFSRAVTLRMLIAGIERERSESYAEKRRETDSL